MLNDLADTIFVTERVWHDILDEREQKEVAFAKTYAREYAHGTAGHNRLMLIAKMANLLSAIEVALYGTMLEMSRGGSNA